MSSKIKRDRFELVVLAVGLGMYAGLAVVVLAFSTVR